MASPLISVSDAQARLFALGAAVPSETLPLAAAAGRWLASEVYALRTQPYADLSAMDGFAVRFDDLPGPLRVIGESAAGRPFTGTCGAHEAVRIFTGAAVPPGADSVLVQEEAAREGDSLTLSGDGPVRGGNIRRRGLDFASGEVLIAKGERLTAARVALAAIAGHAELTVARRLRVAVVASGDELVAPGASGPPDALPESKSVMLATLLGDLPVDVLRLGILPDRLDAIAAAFAAVEADILVTTGGASVGDHDLIRPALEAAGGRIDFWRIALRPGKPMLAGRLRGTTVLGLPGNPVSAFVTATVFLRPLIAHLSGARDAMPVLRTAILGSALPANGVRQDYLRAETRDGRVYVAQRQDSSLLRTLAEADCLIARAPHTPAAEPGDSVEILALP